MADVVQRLNHALSGRYAIDHALGEGGMATVYLAHDLKHDRKVALKVLKPELAAVLGAERFVVEIKTTASLQHPHILPLFDSGQAIVPPLRHAERGTGGEAFLYYVMPYVEGETLRDKLNRETQIGIDVAVRINTEVADALDYAHRHGVIHRDIKPENVLLHDGRPMVADFGIALVVSAAAGGRMTETGLSLGTPHYMSPEQATAEKELTGRSDVYSLASVLYEMLTGTPPHTGASAQQIIMKIVTEEPAPVTQLRKAVPPNVAAAVAKALEKLPADRFETARAFAEALANPAFRHGGAAAGSGTAGFGAGDVRRWKVVSLGLGATAAVLALILLWRMLGPRRDASDDRPMVRFTLAGDPAVIVDSRKTSPFAVSPDGRTIVFRAGTDTTPPQLWVRRIGDPRERPLEGTEGAMNPVISPDGGWVAFVTSDSRTLRKVRISGGDPTTIASPHALTAALSWAPNDEIIFEQLSSDLGIHRVDASGGNPELAVPFDSTAGEVLQRRPLVLRGTVVVVYASYVMDQDEPELALYRLSDGRRARLRVPGNSPLAFIDGHLVYSRTDGALLAVPLDLDGLRATGRAVPLEPRVGSNGAVGTAVGLSAGGTLVYRVPGATAASRLELVDTAASARGIPGQFTVQGAPRFSPDGRHVVVPIGAGALANWLMRLQAPADLWVVDLASGSPTRLTSGDMAASPSWFPDGRRLLYSALVNQRWELWSVPLDGSAPPSRLVELPSDAYGASVVPDGGSAVVLTGRRAESELVRLWLDGTGRSDTLVATGRSRQVPAEPRVSPDGRWVAYLDQQGWGEGNVWVRALEGSTALQVSVSGTGGNPAVWGPDSRRLYYATTDGLVVIELHTSPSLAVVRRRTIRSFHSAAGVYDLSPDGKTFVVANPVNPSADVIVAVNWADQARRVWRGGGTP